MDTAKLQRLIEVDTRLARLDTIVTDLKAERAQLERDILTMFEADGRDITSVKINGCTVHLHRTLRGRVEPGIPKDDVLTALNMAGLEEYIYDTYNLNSLSALLRQWEKDGEDIPAPLQGIIGTWEDYRVRVKGIRPDVASGEDEDDDI